MNKKLKVMHVMQNLEIGGLENGVVNLVNRFDRGSFDAAICCLRGLGRLEERVDGDVKIFDLDEKAGFHPSTVLKIASLCLKEEVDVVHTHGWAGGFFSGVIGAKLSLVPVILNGEHGVMYFESPLRALAQRCLARVADGIVPVCGDLKKNVIHYFKVDDKKVFPIINGVDTDKFRQDSAARRAGRKELGIGENEIVIGSVGRLVPVKDYSSLLKAAAKVLKEIPQARFLMVGDGPIRNELENLAAALGVNKRVIFAGARKDIPQLLNAMDIFVLPSISEGLSNTVLEAMSTGLPVIATRVGGNIEIIIDNKTGIFTEVGDHEKLAEEIINMSGKSRRISMGDEGRKRIIDCFSLKRMVLDYEKLYRELYSRKMEGVSKKKVLAARNITQQKGEIL